MTPQQRPAGQGRSTSDVRQAPDQVTRRSSGGTRQRRRVRPANGRNQGTTTSNPKQADGEDTRDRIGIIAVGTASASVVAVVGLAIADAPVAAYGAIGAIGTSALTAVGIYLGRRTR